ncbi:hypothetical protein CW304_28890 [Bacillus sp. UFRGS-B20]|nr:hypothetical protein CW304_28890 [Bacillus sp. UFRGS-B20]
MLSSGGGDDEPIYDRIYQDIEKVGAHMIKVGNETITRNRIVVQRRWSLEKQKKSKLELTLFNLKVYTRKYL